MKVLLFLVPLFITLSLSCSIFQRELAREKLDLNNDGIIDEIILTTSRLTINNHTINLEIQSAQKMLITNCKAIGTSLCNLPADIYLIAVYYHEIKGIKDVHILYLYDGENIYEYGAFIGQLGLFLRNFPRGR